MDQSAANQYPIHICGAFFSSITGTSTDGTPIVTKSMIYVSQDVSGFFLSYETMMDLGTLSRDFPTPGCAFPSTNSQINGLLSTDSTPPRPSTEPCQCPRRGPVPPRPTKLPFPCTPDNNDQMEEWLRHYFGSSVFNVCPHQPLPSMDRPLLEIHLSKDPVPIAHSKPASIPIHWQQQVYDELM